MYNEKTKKEKKKLIVIIKRSVDELRRYEITEFNSRISQILMLLFEKNTLLLKQGLNYIHTTNSRMKRLDVIEGTMEADRIKKIDEEVDSMVLKLGLKK